MEPITKGSIIRTGVIGFKWNLIIEPRVVVRMEPSQRGFQVEPITDGSKWNPQPAVPLGTVLVQSKNHLEMVPYRTKTRLRLWDSAKNHVWFHIE
jgi:hypothetical protein